MDQKKIISVLSLLLLAASVFAQSNDVIDDVLAQNKLTCGNGAYLTLTAAGMIEDSLTPEEALDVLKQKGWINDSRESSDCMSLGEYSLALMQGFDMKGGIMYSIFKAPRYASRELGYKGYISREPGAYRTLSGAEAISILGQVIRRGE